MHNNQRIAIFGDSIVWGAWDTEKQGWVNRLKAQIETQENWIQIYNRGISGENTNMLTTHLESECKALIPNIIIIAIGINDSYYIRDRKNARVSLSQFKENLKHIQNSAEKFTNQIIFLGLTKVNENHTAPCGESETFYDNENIQIYNQAIQDHCGKHNSSFLNLHNLLKRKDLQDGLHPNSQGHEKIFQAVFNHLNSI